MQFVGTLGPQFPSISCAGSGVCQLSVLSKKVEGRPPNPTDYGLEFLRTIKQGLGHVKGSRFFCFSDRVDDTHNMNHGLEIAKWLEDNKLGKVATTGPFINGQYGTGLIQVWVFVPDTAGVTKFMKDNPKEFAA